MFYFSILYILILYFFHNLKPDFIKFDQKTIKLKEKIVRKQKKQKKLRCFDFHLA